MQGIRNCQEQGLKVGLRFTLNRMNVAEVPRIFDLLEKAEIRESVFIIWCMRDAVPILWSMT